MTYILQPKNFFNLQYLRLNYFCDFDLPWYSQIETTSNPYVVYYWYILVI